MYAVIRTGGKQYRVSPGDVIDVEKLPGEVGQTVELKDVLLVSNDAGDLQIGQPVVAGATVYAEIVDQDAHRKVIVFKFRRRKRYQRKAGHRQPFTALKIGDISTPTAAA